LQWKNQLLELMCAIHCSPFDFELESLLCRWIFLCLFWGFLLPLGLAVIQAHSRFPCRGRHLDSSAGFAPKSFDLLNLRCCRSCCFGFLRPRVSTAAQSLSRTEFSVSSF
jgi:hypothetical protein